MKKSRIEITQGDQDKGALGQARVRDDEVEPGTVFGDDLLPKKEQIEVDGPRALWNRPPPTKRGLDLLTDGQQTPGIPSRGIDRQNHIEKAGLVEVANWVCLIERGKGSHGESMIEQSPNSLQEVGSPVPKVGSKPQISSLRVHREQIQTADAPDREPPDRASGSPSTCTLKQPFVAAFS
jgi:hypothetical protein